MVRALSSNPQQALNMALQSAGIDPAQGKKELSSQQIQALSQHLAELPPVQKKWATEGLQKALQKNPCLSNLLEGGVGPSVSLGRGWWWPPWRTTQRTGTT